MTNSGNHILRFNHLNGKTDLFPACSALLYITLLVERGRERDARINVVFILEKPETHWPFVGH